MSKYVIVPTQRVGDITFGMKREDVRKILGTGFEEFKKNIFSKEITDDYGFCHVYYNGNKECEAIEFFEEDLICDGVNLFKADLQKLREMFEDLKDDGEGYYLSNKYSIGITLDGDRIDGILVGEKGYYEI